jgi:methylmalonyl-CoA epimerase
MGKIDHIGIAVNSLTESIPVFAAVLGENPTGRESVPSEGVNIVFFGEGDGRIELLEPTDPGSPISRFIRDRGPGLHHVCVSVPDLEAALARLENLEILPITPGVRTGAGGRRIAFLHPRDTGGTLLELTEESGG